MLVDRSTKSTSSRVEGVRENAMMSFISLIWFLESRIFILLFAANPHTSRHTSRRSHCFIPLPSVGYLRN